MNLIEFNFKRISKGVFHENKARQIFRITNISYPLKRSCKCAYQGVRNVRFPKNLVCFVFLEHPFWDSPFWLITDDNGLSELVLQARLCSYDFDGAAHKIYHWSQYAVASGRRDVQAKPSWGHEILESAIYLSCGTFNIMSA